LKVLLIDDHQLFLEGMESVLRRIDSSIEVSLASTLEEGLQTLESEPDLVITDLGLPGLTGIDALKAIRSASPLTPAVVLSGSEDALSVREAIDEGASGYIFKKSDSNEFAEALATILDGGVYLPPVALSTEQIAVKAVPEITKRKKDVLRALIRGLSNKEIARELFISEDTVKSHIREIFELLGVHNRTRAVYAVAHLGIRLD